MELGGPCSKFIGDTVCLKEVDVEGLLYMDN
jgi:hypothetical protein